MTADFTLFRIFRVHYEPDLNDYVEIATPVTRNTREEAKEAARRLSRVPIIVGDDSFIVIEE